MRISTGSTRTLRGRFRHRQTAVTAHRKLCRHGPPLCFPVSAHSPCLPTGLKPATGKCQLRNPQRQTYETKYLKWFGRTQLLKCLVASSLAFYFGIEGISNAALISLEISGHVGAVVGDPFSFGLIGGESFSAFFTYDTVALPASPSSDQTYYIQTTSYKVTVAGHQFTGNDWFVFMSNDTFGDFFELSAGSDPAGFGTVAIDGIPKPNVGFTFAHKITTASIFTDLALPVSPFPPLSAFMLESRLFQRQQLRAKSRDI